MRSGSPALALAALATLAACGGSSSPTGRLNANGAPPPPPSGSNALRVTVDGALCTASGYIDEPCGEVTICTPDQVDCQTVSGLLIDTGSFGLRIFKQALTIPLPVATAAGGTVATCARFGDGSSDWGPVASAAVILGQEPAVQVPVQIIDASFGPAPASCASPETSPSVAGFNGILGIGAFVADCGPGCAGSAANGVYFTCSGGSCAGYAAPVAQQIQNPAALVGADGAGLVVHLPAVPAGGATSAEGEVRLGVATRSNNQPSGAAALPLDGYGDFRVSAMGTAFSAFADTGSNAWFFTPPASVTSLPACPSPLASWYCPASTQTFPGSASPTAGGTAIPFDLQVANFEALMTGPDAVFATIAGSGLGSGQMDLGLPFYLGRDVWIVFEGRGSPLGTGPLIAF